MGAIRETRSVCPVCLKPVAARQVTWGDTVYLEKSCAEHGAFSVPVWRGKVSLNEWRGGIAPLSAGEQQHCPQNCGLCGEHLKGTCCVVLEVTRQCNLECSYCFADGARPDPDVQELKSAIRSILSAEDKPLIQLTGGEPTLRPELPELVAYAKEQGCKYVQVNSNGLRLAQDEGLVRDLAQAGLSFVFMQFDGVTDDVHEAMRGKPLLRAKLHALEMCSKYNIGVTLVPTIVRGVNDHQIGDIIRFAAAQTPAVRGVHFQPASYFGRYPSQPPDDARYTLDELLLAVQQQAGIDLVHIRPSRCDHPMCGFHGSFIAYKDGTLQPLTRKENAGEASCCDTGQGCCTTVTPRQNREYIGSRWQRQEPEESCCCEELDPSTLDGFLHTVREYGFTLTAMAFQDAMDLDVERLRQCSLHVYDSGKMRPFCAQYLTPVKD